MPSILNIVKFASGTQPNALLLTIYCVKGVSSCTANP